MSAIVRLRLATLALFVQADRVLLLHQMTLPESDTWDLPGGGVKPEEPLLTALRREVQEETGICEFTVDRLLTVAEGFSPDPKVAVAPSPDAPPCLLHTVNLIYQCQLPDGPITLQADAHDEVGPRGIQWLEPHCLTPEQCFTRSWAAMQAAGLVA
ncbi:NUDIX domain-containing protein [Trichothermofontia sp.]